MIFFPNCKINLGLNILRRRNDGCHDLETVFFPLPLKDALEITQADSAEQEDVLFTSSGLTIAGNENDNLCIKAYRLLKKDFPELPKVKIHLHKNIPMGAGLGGGSADGAFVLKLLNKKFNLQISNGQLINYALELGSDCPFFIINEPCFAESRGEVLQTFQLDLSSYRFVIVNPGIHIGTSWAFSHVVPQQPSKSIKDIILQPVETWKKELKNDFEKPVLRHYKEIDEIKTLLYNSGAVYASMTGSGSTVFAIFPEAKYPELFFPSHYIYRIF